MITDVCEAWQVEKGDLITLGGDSTFTVAEYSDTGEGVSITVKDDDGDCETFYFMPFDPIELVVSLDDPVEDEVDSLS